MRLPIAALLVGFGRGPQVAAQQAAAPARLPPVATVRPVPSDVYLHTISPGDTLIAVSRTLEPIAVRAGVLVAS